MMSSGSLRRDEAVVVGGSMAGLLATRVLADHFGRVTVIDRDRFPTDPEFRPGVPQSHHLHVLLSAGRRILEPLFPGIEEEWRTGGAVQAEWPRDALWLTPQGWSGRFVHDFRMVCASREFLEWVVRRRVTDLGHVRFLEGREVVGLIGGGDGRSVEGIRFRTRGSGNGDLHSVDELPASLVVDASGRSSRAPEWLDELGYPKPDETTVTPLLGYASRYYAIPTDLHVDWKLLFIQATPANPRGGALFPVEGDRWIVTLGGYGGDYPPTDDDAFLAFAESIRSPVLAHAIRQADPLTPIRGYRRTENRRRFYERLTRQPERFLVMGDAVSAFNPIYGEGMSVAAMSAVALDRLLRERTDGDLAGLPARFQREAARVSDGAWLLATGEDLRYPATEGGDRDLKTRLTHKYLDRVIAAATTDERVNLAFLRVLQLVAAPPTLFRPRILLAALFQGRPRGTDSPPTATPLDGVLRYHEVRVDGVRSPVLEAGPVGADEAVVFVHGNPGSSQDWASLASVVGEFGRAVALDMPGFGHADKPRDFDYTIEGYARHLGGALDLLGVRRVHLVLHDFAGPWGLAWAIAHPEEFASATLIDTGVLLDYRWHYLARIWRAPWLGELFMATATRMGFRLLLKHGNPRGLSPTFIDRMYEDFDADTKRAVLRLYRATNDPPRRARRMADALRALPRPALVVWGRHDPFVPAALAERQREVFPDAEVVVFEGSGHWPFADDPEGVARVVVPFLRRVKGGDAGESPAIA
jgi:pimeloyl-ACP methyl ester carboxylesterase/flavin-dependent dehydrogenase